MFLSLNSPSQSLPLKFTEIYLAAQFRSKFYPSYCGLNYKYSNVTVLSLAEAGTGFVIPLDDATFLRRCSKVVHLAIPEVNFINAK